MTLALLIAAALASAQAPAAAPAPNPAIQADRLFALILSPGPKWQPGKPFAEQGLRPHFDYWVAQYKAGKVASAGPVGDDSGLVILRLSGQAEADAILAADPAIAAGIFTGTVRPYAPPMVRGALLGADKPKP